MAKKALGKGLQALIPAYPDQTTETNADAGIVEININDIEPNLYQPRKVFDEDSMFQLAQSIKEVGILQPIIAKRDGAICRIVAGERRWRAARLAGLKTVPVILRDLSDMQSMEATLIENLQREDLNPIEEALGFEQLIDEYEMTQDQISDVVCKSRSAIANSLRLLKLSKSIQNLLVDRKISPGHARALLSLEDQFLRERIAEEIVTQSFNVRQTENMVKDREYLSKFYSSDKPKKKAPSLKAIDERTIALERIETGLKNLLGTNVKLTSSGGKGKIVISFYDDEHLQKILDSVGLGNIIFK